MSFTDTIENYSWVAVVILGLWSAANLWLSWKIGRALRLMDEERETLRRWSRLRELERQQNLKWQ